MTDQTELLPCPSGYRCRTAQPAATPAADELLRDAEFACHQAVGHVSYANHAERARAAHAKVTAAFAYIRAAKEPPTVPLLTGLNVEAAARRYCRMHHPGAEKWTLDEALTMPDKYWKRYVHEVTEILEAAAPPASEPKP